VVRYFVWEVKRRLGKEVKEKIIINERQGDKFVPGINR